MEIRRGERRDPPLPTPFTHFAAALRRLGSYRRAALRRKARLRRFIFWQRLTTRPTGAGVSPGSSGRVCSASSRPRRPDALGIPAEGRLRDAPLGRIINVDKAEARTIAG